MTSPKFVFSRKHNSVKRILCPLSYWSALIYVDDAEIVS